jgi:serine/threonine-protein kinase
MINQNRIDALVVRFEELQAEDTPVTAEDLCRDCPELLDELKRQIRVLQAINAVLNEDNDTDGDAPSPSELVPAGAFAEALSAGCQFHIQRLHARGGLGEVLVARDEALHREVALKRLQAPHTYNPQVRRRFLREAEITSRLEHPSIVPVHAVGQDAGGRPFYAMRFVQGETLHNAIQQFHQADQPGRDPGERLLSLRQLLGRFVAVCNSIGYAHSRGIIHRDIKPANILLGPYGETLLVDWGLAKPTGAAATELADDAEALPADDDGGPAGTQLGSVIGTPAYMSPEQAEGRGDIVGPAGDIYGLGATLYVLLTGRTPFQGRNSAEILDRVKRGEFLSPRQRKKDIPPALEAICLKAMARQPERRHATPLALAADVEHWLADEPVSAWREPWTVRLRRWLGRHRTLVIAAAAVVAVAVVSLAAATWLLSAANQRERKARDQATKNLQLARQARDQAAKNLQVARQAVDEFCTKVNGNPRLADQDLEGLRKELLHSAVRFHEEFVREGSDDPDIRAEQGWAYHQLGEMALKIASPEEAMRYYQRALDIFDRLSRAHPTVADYRQGLGQSYHGRGILYSQTGRPDGAEEDLARAHEIRQELVRSYPAVAKYRADLAHNHFSRGSLFRRNKPLDLALAEMVRSRDLWKELVREHPTVSSYRNGLANVQLNLGVFYFENKHQPKASEQELRQALAIWEELARAQPGYPEYLNKQAYVHNNLGVMYSRLRRYAEAGASYQKALGIREELVRTHPAVNDYQSKLAKIHHNLGDLYQRTGRPAEAEAAFQKAVAIKKSLAEAHPRVPAYLVDLGQSYAHLGHLKKGTDPQAALKWLDLACQTQKAALQIEPKLRLARLCLSHVHEGQATALSQLGRHEEALKEWDQALVQATGTYHDVWRMGRARTLVHLGDHGQACVEARGLAAKEGVAGFILYEAAAVFALSVTAVGKDARVFPADRDKLAEEYAASAIELLRRAGTNGFFQAPANRVRLRRDAAFAAIRSRAEIQKLLAELEKGRRDQ